MTLISDLLVILGLVFGWQYVFPILYWLAKTFRLTD